MAARPVHFLRIGSLLRCLSRCLASKHGITKSYIVSSQMFKLQTSSESLNRHTLYLPWELRRVLSRVPGKTQLAQLRVKVKVVCLWRLPPCLISYQIVWTSALILWSDLDLIPSANLTLNHAPPPRLSCFTPRAHTSNGICRQNRNAMSSVHDKLSQSRKENFEMATHQVLTGCSTQSDVAFFETGSSLVYGCFDILS